MSDDTICWDWEHPERITLLCKNCVLFTLFPVISTVSKIQVVPHKWKLKKRSARFLQQKSSITFDMFSVILCALTGLKHRSTVFKNMGRMWGNFSCGNNNSRRLISLGNAFGSQTGLSLHSCISMPWILEWHTYLGSRKFREMTNYSKWWSEATRMRSLLNGTSQGV